MSHARVIPRDFFNESKLLKMLGKFEIAVRFSGEANLPIETIHDGEPFDIRQDPSSGQLFCSNYRASLNGYDINLFIPYNAKSEWCLFAMYRGSEYWIFDDNGKWMPNFGVTP